MENIELLVEALRKEGLRFTDQRKFIWDEITSSDDHREAEDIFLSLRKKNINVSRATVYRTIDVLVKNNLVRKIDLGDNPAKFERQTEHHNHIVCVNCGSIEEYFDKIIEQRQIKIIEELGFKMIRHTQNLFVLCKNCL